MTGSSSFTTWARRGAIALSAGLLVLAAACSSQNAGGNSSQGGSTSTSAPAPLGTSSIAQKADTPDQVANAVLKAAGYTTSKDIPEFGTYAAGIDLTATARYMVVVTVKTAQDAQTVKAYYQKNPQQGVTVTTGVLNGVNYVAFKIDSVKDGKTALKNIGKALRGTAQGSL